jgi:hypothetical protein
MREGSVRDMLREKFRTKMNEKEQKKMLNNESSILAFNQNFL